MATFSKEIKSNRLLQSRRYTRASLDSQEAFDKVIDLSADEIYSQANLFSGLGRFFGRLLGSPKSGSVLFLENTGTGTKNLLFGNLDYNRYKPGYNRTFFDRLRGGSDLGEPI